MRLGPMLFTASGRIRRRDYWLYSVINVGAWFLFSAVLYGTLAVMGLARPADGHGGGQWSYLYLPVFLWASLCLTTKRLHDRNVSAVWSVLGLVPVIGWIWSIVVCGCLDGTPGDNRYGPPSKG